MNGLIRAFLDDALMGCGFAEKRVDKQEDPQSFASRTSLLRSFCHVPIPHDPLMKWKSYSSLTDWAFAEYGFNQFADICPRIER